MVENSVIAATSAEAEQGGAEEVSDDNDEDLPDSPAWTKAFTGKEFPTIIAAERELGMTKENWFLARKIIKEINNEIDAEYAPLISSPGESHDEFYWRSGWKKQEESVTLADALKFTVDTAERISNSELKDHLKSSVIFQKTAHDDILALKNDVHRLNTQSDVHGGKICTTQSKVDKILEKQQLIADKQIALESQMNTFQTQVTNEFGNLNRKFTQILELLAGKKIQHVKEGERRASAELQARCKTDLLAKVVRRDGSGDGGSGTPDRQTPASRAQTPAITQTAATQAQTPAKTQTPAGGSRTAASLKTPEARPSTTADKGKQVMTEAELAEDFSKFMQKISVDGQEKEVYYRSEEFLQNDEVYAKMLQEEEEKEAVESQPTPARAKRYKVLANRGRGRGRGRARGGRTGQSQSSVNTRSVSAARPEDQIAPTQTRRIVLGEYIQSGGVGFDDNNEEEAGVSLINRRQRREQITTSSDAKPSQVIESSTPKTPAEEKQVAIKSELGGNLKFSFKRAEDTESEKVGGSDQLLWIEQAKRFKAQKSTVKSGLGVDKGQLYMGEEVSFAEPNSLLDHPGDFLSQKHLDKLEYVYLVKDTFTGDGDSDVLLYFLTNGRVLKLREVDILRRQAKELLYVLYLFNGESEAAKEWRKSIQVTISQKQKFNSMISKDTIQLTKYIPKYVKYDGTEEVMTPGMASIEVFLGERLLEFNKEASEPGTIYLNKPLENNSLNHLRAAIEQIDEINNSELSDLKKGLLEAVKKKEMKLVHEFLKNHWEYKHL